MTSSSPIRFLSPVPEASLAAGEPRRFAAGRVRTVGLLDTARTAWRSCWGGWRKRSGRGDRG
jgi:hypothetical protein